MKKHIKILTILFYTSIVSYLLTCFLYWVLNPELSQMEILLKFWYWFVINIGFGIWFAKFDLG